MDWWTSRLTMSSSSSLSESLWKLPSLSLSQSLVIVAAGDVVLGSGDVAVSGVNIERLELHAFFEEVAVDRCLAFSLSYDIIKSFKIRCFKAGSPCSSNSCVVNVVCNTEATERLLTPSTRFFVCLLSFHACFSAASAISSVLVNAPVSLATSL